MSDFQKEDRVEMNFGEGETSMGTVYVQHSPTQVFVIQDGTEDMYDMKPERLKKI